MKAIEVISNENSGYNHCLEMSLLDKIIVEGIMIYINNDGDYKAGYIQNSRAEEINSNFKHFNRLSTLQFYFGDTDKQLEAFKKVDIKSVEMLNFDNLFPKDFEEFVVHENFNYAIYYLQYQNDSWVHVSNNALINISKIKFKELILPNLNTVSDCIRVLSHLPENVSLEFGENSSKYSTLRFSNSVIYLKGYDEWLNLHWKDIHFQYNYNLKQDDMWFFDNNNIMIRNVKNVKFSHFRTESNSSLFGIDLDNTANANNFWIISANSLKELRLTFVELIELLGNENNKK